MMNIIRNSVAPMCKMAMEKKDGNNVNTELSLSIVMKRHGCFSSNMKVGGAVVVLPRRESQVKMIL